ncbi:hypothetical protein HY642_06880 [Candidatus Woesearchaeota archaeon]|nr:hypothetical protein [Candidatus Woesearchaeota archaeon]
MMPKRSFRFVFGDGPAVKVLDFFLDNREFDYTPADVVRSTGVAWATLQRFMPDLVRMGIITKTRQIGRGQLYKLNSANPVVGKLIDIDFAISDYYVKKEIGRQGSHTQQSLKSVRRATAQGQDDLLAPLAADS